MKEVKYKCNMCGEVKQPKDLMCMYYKVDIIPQRFIISSDISKSDKHICLNCLKVVKEYFEGN